MYVLLVLTYCVCVKLTFIIIMVQLLLLYLIVVVVVFCRNYSCSAAPAESEGEVTSSVRDDTPTNVNAMTEGLMNYDDAHSMLHKLLSLIYNRYEMNGNHGSQLFMAANNIGRPSWDIIKHKLAIKMLSPDASFLMVFTGSSVTAGHDNYYNQSYPFVFRDRMANIFSKLGIKLEVHNIALGANNCFPYVLCYESMGGLDPDFINWEQSYNCGRDSAIFETALRVAAMSQHKGIIYYSASGAWSPSNCPKSSERVPYSAEEWTPTQAGLDEWVPTTNELGAIKASLFKFNEDNPSYGRFVQGFRNDYVSAVAMHGFNVWEVNKHCKFTNPKTGAVENCNGIDAAGGCAMKFMTLEASLYGSDNQRGANWHPTRAFHMLRGEAIAWIYALILLETVQMVHDALVAGSTKQLLLRDYQSKLNKLTSKMPKRAKFCDHPFHCTQQRPVCYTDYRPHHPRNMTLSELIVGTTAWTYDPATLGDWSLHYGYLDAKPVYESRGVADGEIFFAITISSNNPYFWICGERKDAVSHLRLMLDLNALDTLDNRLEYIPPVSRTELLPNHHMIGGSCVEVVDMPPGRHVIGVSTSPQQPSHHSIITHIILWP